MKYKFLIFAIGFVALIAFQAKVIMPWVYDIVASDLFLEDSGDDPSRFSSNTAMTDKAFEQCKTNIASKILPDETLSFTEKPTSAFSLGNFEYIISSDIEISPPDEASYTRKYACRIRFLEKDDTANITDPDNWSISGISGLDNI
ncbi:MAG: hypothetical protein V3U87_06175 [Methylococcaceae bacterium]